MEGWIKLVRALGESLLEVWRAELDTLQADLKVSGRHLGLALGLLGAALVLGFWIVGLLLFALVALLHVWLLWWGASLIVLALFALAAGLLIRFGLAQSLEDRRGVAVHLDLAPNVAQDALAVDEESAALDTHEFLAIHALFLDHVVERAHFLVGIAQ